MRTRFASAGAAILLAAATFAGTAGTALMALAPISVTTPLESFQAGTSQVPSTGWVDISSQVNQGYNYGVIGVDTTGFPTADTVAVRLEFTGDNGATVQQGCGFTTIGGSHVDRRGNPIFPSCGSQLPAKGSSGLKVRAQVTIPEAGQLRLGAQLAQQPG